MRFKVETEPKKLSRRIISTFLWTPLKLQNEWRWLEKASIGQTYFGANGWRSEEWAN
jgi:hypothetical protein|tara:strand:+ start:661 stop:831 length:171 start_codon:yes stop_codon:yes gene_type:complete